MAKRKRKGRERAELLCMLVADLPEPTPDTIIRHCYGCKEEIWVATKNYDMLSEKYDLDLICQPCAVARPGDHVAMAVDPRQIDDMRASGLSDVEIIFTLAVLKCATIWGVSRDDALMRLEMEHMANKTPPWEFQSAAAGYTVMLTQWDARN